MSKANKIQVLVVRPHEPPEVAVIDNRLEVLQHMVGGYIEAVYPFADEVALVCNEEGKLNSLPLNRALFDEDGGVYDIIAGTFLVVGLGEEDFDSLTPELLDKYRRRFELPEDFFFRSQATMTA